MSAYRRAASVALLVFSSVSILGPRCAAAQSAATGASIAGRVTDATGAVVAGAAVVARHVQRAQTWTTTSDMAGRYRFAWVPPGDVEVSVSLGGFGSEIRVVPLAAGQAVDLPCVLAVAAIAQTVSVTADRQAVDLTHAQAAARVSPAEIASLPLNGRNYLDLALLVPGVSRTNIRNTERFAETSAVPGTGISVAGQRNLNNSFVLDGFSANDDAAALAGTYVSQEVIRELNVTTSGATAEFGRASSGVLAVVTQSGTADWRGRGYGFWRTDRLDARNAFATGKDPLRQTQAGATIGGPVTPGRTFVFGNVELTRQSRTGFVSISAVNVAAINARLDAVGYGGPRVGTGAFAAGYDTTNIFARLDHQASPAHQVTARYLLYDVTSANARSVGGLNDASRSTSLDDRDQTGSLASVASLGSGFLNEARAQATHSRLAAPATDPVGPAVTINGVASFGTSTSSPTGRVAHTYEASDTVSWQHGAHLWKAGASFLLNRVTITFPGAQPGVYTFSSLAAFRAGNYTTYQQAFGEAGQFQSNPNLGVFAEDEWRIADPLTLQAGLRYDVQALADPVRADRNNVAPRVGLVWAPGDRRTVVRASSGVYFDRVPLRAISNALQRDGSKYRVAVMPFGTPGAPAFPGRLAAFPSSLLVSVTTIDPRIEAARSTQWHAEVARTLAHGVSMSAGYMRLDGSGIIMSRNANAPTLPAAEAARLGVANLGRPDPAFANVSRYESIGRSRYDGLTASLDARAGRWGRVRVSYTFSRAYDDAGNAFFSAPQDNSRVHDDWGPSDNDQRHRVVLSGSAMAAAGPAAVKGWQVAYFFAYGSPFPYNVQTGGDRNNDTNVNDRPEGVGRNSARGFDSATLDLRISRAIAFGAHRRLELLVEGFNVLNRLNRLFPNNIIGTGVVASPTFGLATAAGDPRQVQVGVRVDF